MKCRLLSVFAVLLTIGCGGESAVTANEECGEAADCGATLVCVSGRCVLPQCTVDQECRPGLVCIEYQCRFIGDAGPPVTGPDAGDAELPETSDSSVVVDAGEMDGSTLDEGTQRPDDAQIPDASAAADVGVPDANEFEFDLSIPRDDAGPEPDAAADVIEVDAEPMPECQANIDCPEGLQCTEGRCLLRCDDPNAPACPDGEVCIEDVGRCEAARPCDPACADGFRCDLTEGRCVAAPDDPLQCGGPCPAGFRCDEATRACRINDCAEDPFGGNATAEMAAALALGRTRNLSLCTERDWFIIDLTDPAQPMPTSLRVSATAGQDDGNLELSLYPEGFVPGQRPLSDASTDANPERLTADALPGGRYLLAVHAFVGAGQVQQPISYDLMIETSENGFCGGVDECEPGFRCEMSRCVVFDDPCEGACGALEVCDAELQACLSECLPDQFNGANVSRESAAEVQLQQYRDLTRCAGESDWYRVTIPRAGTLVASIEGAGDRFRNDVSVELWGEELPEANPDPEAPPPEPLQRSAFVGELFEQVEHRFDRATNAFLRVYGSAQSSYALNLTLGSACDFDWDCCADDEPACHRRCDGLAGVCVDQVCGVDFQCDGRLVCDQAGRACVEPQCIEDGFGGNNRDPGSAIPLPGVTRLEGLVTCDRAEDWFRVAMEAGDGIEVAITFEDDGVASYDLEFRSVDRVLHESISANDNEALAYNVDETGDYFIRVFGALRGQYDLSSDVIPGGIAVIPCDEQRACGVERLCQPGAAPQCVSETCLGDNPNIICQLGYECTASGRCECSNRDQFQETNASPQSAIRVEDGFTADLTLCDSEDDWFQVNVADLGAPVIHFITEDDGGLNVDILDSDLFPVGQQRIFGADRLNLDPALGEIYVVVSANGDPRPLSYQMTVGQ